MVNRLRSESFDDDQNQHLKLKWWNCEHLWDIIRLTVQSWWQWTSTPIVNHSRCNTHKLITTTERKQTIRNLNKEEDRRLNERTIYQNVYVAPRYSLEWTAPEAIISFSFVTIAYSHNIWMCRFRYAIHLYW